jgi:hypothetical protein
MRGGPRDKAYRCGVEQGVPTITPGHQYDKEDVVRPYYPNDKPGKANGALSCAPPDHDKGVDRNHLGGSVAVSAEMG